MRGLRYFQHSPYTNGKAVSFQDVCTSTGTNPSLSVRHSSTSSNFGTDYNLISSSNITPVCYTSKLYFVLDVLSTTQGHIRTISLCHKQTHNYFKIRLKCKPFLKSNWKIQIKHTYTNLEIQIKQTYTHLKIQLKHTYTKSKNTNNTYIHKI